MAITVTNSSTFTVSVAINQWGNDGDTSYFELDANSATESWDRTDERGFVMSVIFNGTAQPYCVNAGDNITIVDGPGPGQITILDNGVAIQSCQS